MEIYIQANGIKMFSKEMEYIFLAMEIDMKENYIMDKKV